MPTLLANGVEPPRIDRADAAIVDKLRLPDGTPFDRYEQWDRFKSKVELLVEAIHKEQRELALELLDDAKETWRRLHDRDVDHSYGLMDEIVVRFGEAEIGAMWDRVLMPLFAWRYDKFDISKHEWPEALDNLMLVAIEAMRGHLVGPERTGDMELEEHEDRFVLRFDPCGSGQRTVRGDWIEGTPPRMEPPYNWKASEEPHSWNHYQKGVCHYCTHCIRLMEETADRPLRLSAARHQARRRTRTPTATRQCASAASGRCTRTRTAVPEDVYALTGRKKTGKFGSGPVGAPPLPEVVDRHARRRLRCSSPSWPGVGDPLRIVERPVPDPGEGEVRVRVEACGVCGSDVFLQAGGFVGAPLPIVPGHEAAGVVERVGPRVSGPAVGDQVALYYIDAPADSRYARPGRPNIGPGVRRMGVDVDGAFAEFVVRPATTLIKPPRKIDPAVLAVLTDAVATPYHALRRIAKIQPGETLLVLGIGGIGSNAVQLGRHLGARVIAVGRSPGKLDLAGRLGADVVLADGPQIEDQVRDVTDGAGPTSCSSAWAPDGSTSWRSLSPGGSAALCSSAPRPKRLRPERRASSGESSPCSVRVAFFRTTSAR